MAQINREREDKFFEILKRLEAEFYRDLDDKSNKGYYLNDSFFKAINELIRLRHRIYMPTDYPILSKCNLRYDDITEAIDNLIKGIDENIDLLSGQQQERYIYSLLSPFSKWCDGSINTGIDYIPSHIALNADGDSADESFFQTRYISDKIICQGPIFGGEMLDCIMVHDDPNYTIRKQDYQDVAKKLRSMSYNILLFKLICAEVGTRLDALLLERGANLLWYQNQCGVPLVEDKRNIKGLIAYLGTRELVVKYIDEALPKIDETSEEQPKQEQETASDIWSDMPKALQTAKAIKIFKRAEDAGLITQINNGYKWNKEKQLLAYFAARISDEFRLQKRENSVGKKQYCWQPFETLFNTKGLRTARANCMKYEEEFQPNGFEEIDKLFE